MIDILFFLIFLVFFGLLFGELENGARTSGWGGFVQVDGVEHALKIGQLLGEIEAWGAAASIRININTILGIFMQVSRDLIKIFEFFS